MLYADKQNLKTEIAVDLLRVREKEMNFYSTNLSMVGTQSALLAGFAFAILAQKDFTFPPGGFFPREWREWLKLRDINFPNEHEWTEQEVEQGIKGWSWDVWFTQICQFFHLLLTTIGMTIQLWTLYTCVLTNILGLSLALRGPEGSVDRAVRHMAEQNQLVMNRFGVGVLIFFVSIMLFSLMEYEIYVSLPLCASVTVIFRQMIGNIRSLVNVFWLDQDTVVTGQFLPGDKRREARAAAKIRAQANARLRGEYEVEKRKHWRQVGYMLTGRYDQENSQVALPHPSVRDRWDALVAVVTGRRRDPRSANSRATGLRKWAMSGQQAYSRGQRDLEDIQAPSAVVNKLISRTQDPRSPARPAANDDVLSSGDNSGRASQLNLSSQRSFRWEQARSPYEQRACAASVMQAAARGRRERGRFSAAQSCMQLLRAESCLGTRLDESSQPCSQCEHSGATAAAPSPAFARRHGGGEMLEESVLVERSCTRRQNAIDSTMLSMPLFERLMRRFASPSEREQAAAVQLQSRARGSLARQLV